MLQEVGGAVARTLDLRFIGRRFKSWPDVIAYWLWASYLHLCASVTKQYNLVSAKEPLHSVAGKVIIGLLLHWPCATDLLVYIVVSIGSWP